MAIKLHPAFVLPLAVCLAGCIYPVYKTIQPASQITVLDESNAPIEGATVVLTANFNPYGINETHDVRTSDTRGIAAFEHRSEWQREALMMHGARFYFWNWCVHKFGFKTYRTSHTSGEYFDPMPTVRLSQGPPSECRS
jgi:hypothetical protein